jgi:outer membrane protein OmpA-like peptidoglycan-associated protein
LSCDNVARALAVAVLVWSALAGLSGCSSLPFLQGRGGVEEQTESGALDVIADRVGTDASSEAELYGPPVEAALAEPEVRVPQGDRAMFDRLVDRQLDVRYTERGVVVTFPDSLFEFGSARLTAEARRQLREIAEVLLHEARGRAIAVEGHTDSIGAELYNQGLSERRAHSVAAALVDEGVSEALMTVAGYGSAYPIAPNDNEDGSDNPEGRRRNRRVEIVIE